MERLAPSSPQFVVFLAATAALTFLFPSRWRWASLLLASYIFAWSWSGGLVVVLIGTSAATYVFALVAGAPSSPSRRYATLTLGLLAALLPLAFFKYYAFFVSSFRSLLVSRHDMGREAVLSIMVPMGISFFSLRCLSYFLDVWRGARPPERHAGILALFVAFFPQFLAGPIERSGRLLPQLHAGPGWDRSRLHAGSVIILWGLFKKLVVAQMVAPHVDLVFDRPGAYGGGPVLLAACLYAYQLYCDFSGYTDIAIGASLILGYETSGNFLRPYAATSVPEFWKRWHVSLTGWFRDYLYISLGGNRVPRWRWGCNVLVVFVVSGLWHGAAWNFVAWGMLHGALYLASQASARIRDNCVRFLGLKRLPGLHRLFRVATTFLLVSFTWIFFRAETLTDAVTIAGSLFMPPEAARLDFAPFLRPEVLLVVVALVFVEWAERRRQTGDPLLLLSWRPLWIRWAVYYAALFAIFLFGVPGEDFIYAQF